MLARDKDRYLKGLTLFREDRLADWVELFAAAAAEAATLAAHYAIRVGDLQDEWRERLRQHAKPRADAAAWGLITVLPAHPIVTVPVAVAAAGRTKPAVANAIEQLEAAGILTRLSESGRNRAWETSPAGLSSALERSGMRVCDRRVRSGSLGFCGACCPLVAHPGAQADLPGTVGAWSTRL